MLVNWTDDALDDLAEIVAYITDRNPVAAQKLRSLLTQAAERIPAHPYMHRTGRVVDTREAVVHPNYLVIYRVAEDAIIIASVIHARQQYP